MKKNTLKALGIMVAGTVLAASAGIGCGSKETTDVQPTEIVEAVVETEELEIETEETEAPTEAVVPETETEEAAFTVTDMSATKYAKSSVNVRKGPTSEYEKLGGLSTNQKVTVTGQADTGWYRIDYNGEEGYVSDKYLTDQKVTANALASGNNAASGSTNTSGNNAASGNTNTSGNNAASGSTNTSGNNAASGNTNTSGNNTASGNTNTSGNNGGSENVGNTGNTGNVENSGNTGGTDAPSPDAGNTGTSGNNGGSENAGNVGNTGSVENSGNTGGNGTIPPSVQEMLDQTLSSGQVYDPSENVPGDNWVEMGGGIF